MTGGRRDNRLYGCLCESNGAGHVPQKPRRTTPAYRSIGVSSLSDWAEMPSDGVSLSVDVCRM